MGMSGGQIFHEMMLRHGVRHIFGYPGGAILPVFDAIYNSSEFDFILPRREDGAGHMADGYARVSGKPGVILRGISLMSFTMTFHFVQLREMPSMSASWKASDPMAEVATPLAALSPTQLTFPVELLPGLASVAHCASRPRVTLLPSHRP